MADKMKDKVRVGPELELAGKDEDSRYGNAPERHLWQAHVEAEEERRKRSGEKDDSIHRYAEEYGEIAMRGVDAEENEFQRSMQGGGEKGFGDPSDELANAGDIIGG